jgi:hypothetical protein
MSILRPQGATGALRVTGLAVTALLVALGAAASSPRTPAYADTLVLSGNGTAGAPAATSAATAGSFRISGSVAGLYPGAQLPLVLTVTNPERFAIVVSSLSVAVGPAMPGCGAANLTATSFAGRLHVPALGTAAVSVQVTLAHSAPNACQGAVFPLHYTGLAGKAT